MGWIVGELLTPEMFDELMEIVDAKIEARAVRNSAGPGIAAIRKRPDTLVERFEERFVADRGSYTNYRTPS